MLQKIQMVQELENKILNIKWFKIDRVWSVLFWISNAKIRDILICWNFENWFLLNKIICFRYFLAKILQYFQYNGHVCDGPHCLVVCIVRFSLRLLKLNGPNRRQNHGICLKWLVHVLCINIKPRVEWMFAGIFLSASPTMRLPSLYHS